MPLLKGNGCKSTPAKVMAYVLNPEKAAFVSSQYLNDGQDYAEQFRDTAQLHQKGAGFDERKYYHFKLSCAQADQVSAAAHHEYAQAMAARLFPKNECVIATHTDTETVHSHIIVNSVSFEDGKKLNIRNHQYGQMKDIANEEGVKRGFSSLDFRRPSANRIPSSERHIELKGGTSWKEELREVIQLAKQETSTMADFEKYINRYGVTLTRNTEKSIAYKHPHKEKAIRGERLGAEYTKEEIKHEFANTGRSSGARAGALATDEPAEQGGAGEQSVERSVGGIRRIVREIEEGTKQFSGAGREEIRNRERAEQAECERVAKTQQSANETSSGERAEHSARKQNFIERDGR